MCVLPLVHVRPHVRSLRSKEGLRALCRGPTRRRTAAFNRPASSGVTIVIGVPVPTKACTTHRLPPPPPISPPRPCSAREMHGRPFSPTFCTCRAQGGRTLGVSNGLGVWGIDHRWHAEAVAARHARHKRACISRQAAPSRLPSSLALYGRLCRRRRRLLRSSSVAAKLRRASKPRMPSTSLRTQAQALPSWVAVG